MKHPRLVEYLLKVSQRLNLLEEYLTSEEIRDIPETVFNLAAIGKVVPCRSLGRVVLVSPEMTPEEVESFVKDVLEPAPIGDC